MKTTEIVELFFIFYFSSIELRCLQAMNDNNNKINLFLFFYIFIETSDRLTAFFSSLLPMFRASEQGRFVNILNSKLISCCLRYNLTSFQFC